MAKEILTIVGLGKLGAPIAVCFASKGYRVLAVDVNPEVVRNVNDYVAPVFEPGLQDLMESSRNTLSATGNLEEAVEQSKITFILVPTPSDAAGGFSLKFVLAACDWKCLAAEAAISSRSAYEHGNARCDRYCSS